MESMRGFEPPFMVYEAIALNLLSYINFLKFLAV